MHSHTHRYEGGSTIFGPHQLDAYIEQLLLLADHLAAGADLAIRLQGGLPAGSTAELAITAVDRNYVNWARGGNFNPSGQVRIPSLSGDGTGVFGSTVGRGFDILVTDRPSGLPACPLD